MMVVKLEEGWDRLRAATYAYTSTAFSDADRHAGHGPAGFMPVGFRESRFAGPVTLAGIFLGGGRRRSSSRGSWGRWCSRPYLGMLLLPKKLENQARGTHHDVYDPSRLPPAAKRRRLGRAAFGRGVLVLTVLIFGRRPGAGMLKVQQQFFPTASGVRELLVDLQLRRRAHPFVATERQVKAARGSGWRRTRTSSSSPPTPVPGRRRFLICRSSRNCRNPGFAQFVIKTGGHRAGANGVRYRLMNLFAPRRIPAPTSNGRACQRLGVSARRCGVSGSVPRHRGPTRHRLRENRLTGVRRQRYARGALVRDTQLDWNEQVRSVAGPRRSGQRRELLGPVHWPDIQGLVQDRRWMGAPSDADPPPR